jgi:type III secretory pathway component EscV
MTVNLVHPQVEEWIRQKRHTGLGPEERQKLISAVVDAIGVDDGAGGYRVILTTFKVRRALRRFLEKELPSVIVLAYQELPAELTIAPAKRISW